MPQPLSKVIDQTSGFRIGNQFDSPSRNRPKLALAAMNVIAEWSILESFMTSLFIQMLGANPRPGAAIFAALTSTASQTAALRAVARVALSETENDVFEGILGLYRTSAKERTAIAHGVWGVHELLPDAVLLCDEDVLTENLVDLKEFQEKPDEDIEFPLIDKDRVLVYVEADFVGMSNRIQQLMTLVSAFRFAINRGHPAAARALEMLLKMPPIQKVVSRRSQERKSGP